MRVLLTGSGGFVGGYLSRHLQESGHLVRGFDLKSGNDFRDYEQVRLAIDDFRPDKIFHIGALAYVPESNLDPYRVIETNMIGSLNILEAVRRMGLKTKIHLCGSSEEYGNTPGVLTEESKLTPLSPYAIAKAGMDHLGQFYAKAYGMHVVVTRTFNHTGPGRGEQYAESSWAKQIAEIEQGDRHILRHGDLGPRRNYTDVRDVVKAYALAIDLPPDVYNICSDQNVYMKEVLTMLKSLSTQEIRSEIDENLLRPSDFSFSKPSREKFTKLTNWHPEYKLDQTLKDILEVWRET